MFRTVFREALRALRRNPVRSLLTMLGIIMGVASFIAVVALGNAGSSRVEAQLQNVGDNLIWVEAGSRAKSGIRIGSRGTNTLSLEDVTAVEQQVPEVKTASPNVDGHIQVVYGNNNWGTSFRGVTPEYLDVRRWKVAQGAFFTHRDVEHASAVCVIGATVVEELFAGVDPVGKVIRLNDMPCTISGVLTARGVAPNGFDQDDFVMLPVSTAMKRITGKNYLDDIYFATQSREEMPRVTQEITAVLRERHHLRPDEDNDFNIRSPEDMIRAQLASAQIFTLLLGAIASVSLLVGGIGIMNIMLVSVSQRTREIGIRLACGATEADVKMQFLSEALALSIAGGLLGVLAGVVTANVLQSALGWDILVTGRLLAVSAAFALVIGAVFGYYPARRAAQLDPIVCLRHEQ